MLDHSNKIDLFTPHHIFVPRINQHRDRFREFYIHHHLGSNLLYVARSPFVVEKGSGHHIKCKWAEQTLPPPTLHVRSAGNQSPLKLCTTGMTLLQLKGSWRSLW